MAAAFVQEVRSAARWVFHDLMWFSACPRRQWPSSYSVRGLPFACETTRAGVGALFARLAAGDDALHPAPAGGTVVELLEAARLALLRRGREPRPGVCLQRRDMGAQGGGGRDAEDVADLVALAPVEHLGAAIMAVGAQRDPGFGPVRPDRPQQAAQQGADFRAFGPLGGPQHGGDEAALAVEDDDGLKAIFVVMRIEQPQLLPAVDGVERVVPDECFAFALRYPARSAWEPA